MSLSKLFNRIFFHNNTTPALDEDNLNAMSKAINDIDDRVINLAGTIMEDVPQIQEDIEELEEDFELIDGKITEAQTAANNAQTSANAAAGSVTSAQQKALIAEGWAKGTQNGSPVSQSSPYWQNNAEYWAGKARSFTPTGYQNLVDDVEDVKQTLSDEAETRARLGAHNLLPMTVEGIKAVNTSATWAGNVATLSGMTFTVLTDGDNNVTGVNITGQNSGGTIVFALASHDFGNSTFNSFGTSSTEYIATSGITGDSSTTYGIQYQADIQKTYIRIASGYNFGTGKTIQPMIRLASDPDTTFAPYAMTNQQLTENKIDASEIAPIENGTTASTNYAQGAYFIHNGKFCKAKTAIASGASFTLNTNYEVTTVAAELIALNS